MVLDSSSIARHPQQRPSAGRNARNVPFPRPSCHPAVVAHLPLYSSTRQENWSRLLYLTSCTWDLHALCLASTAERLRSEADGVPSTAPFWALGMLLHTQTSHMSKRRGAHIVLVENICYYVAVGSARRNCASHAPRMLLTPFITHCFTKATYPQLLAKCACQPNSRTEPPIAFTTGTYSALPR
jgi:hypothetical protein